MWPTLVILLLGALICLHWWWRRRYRLAQQEAELQRRLMQALEARQYDDIAQKKAEQQALFDSMIEGVLLLDRQDRIQLANRSLEELFGALSHFRGKTVIEAFRWHELVDLVTRLREQKEIQEQELQLPGIRTRWLQLNATRIYDQAGNHQGAIVVFHDQTRLKELENTRKDFVANVSHELRTPLSLVKGYVETLIDGAKDDPVVASRFLQTIDKQVDRLTYLIEDLLTISRLESGQLTMNLLPTSLQEIAGRVVEDLQSRITAKSVTVRNELPGELLVEADADRLQQVFFNLVDNAIKYGHVQGTVEIGGCVLADGKVEVWVSDDGPGIPSHSLERIFERFYRVDKARSRDQGGTGLGLAIVKHIVQAHGGEVWATSKPGDGSTFSFTLLPVPGDETPSFLEPRR